MNERGGAVDSWIKKTLEWSSNRSYRYLSFLSKHTHTHTHTLIRTRIERSMPCPVTALKDTAVEDVAPAAVALGLCGVAKRMDYPTTATTLSLAVLGLSTFAAAKAKAEDKTANADKRMYAYLGVLSISAIAGLYAGGLFGARGSRKSL